MGNGTVPARHFLPSLGTDNDVVEPCAVHEPAAQGGNLLRVWQRNKPFVSARAQGANRPRSVYRRVDDDAAGETAVHQRQ